MKVLHLNAGAETGGGMVHIISLLRSMNKDEMILGVFEKGPMYYEAKKLGINVKYFGQSSRYDLTILKRVSDYINDENINVVHSHGARANLFSILIKRFHKSNCLWVTTIHSDPTDDFLGSGFKGSIFTKLNLMSLKSMDHLFAISNRFKEMLIQFGINTERITTIYNGIDFEVRSFNKINREKLGLTKSDFIIILIARLHPIKGHIIAFKGLKEILKKYSNVKILLVGDGPLENELKEKVIDLRLEKHVIFLGYQQRVEPFLDIADIKVLLSYSESFPLVILEAARQSVPVISTDVGGVKDLISDSTLGWVIPSKDSEAFVNAIDEAIELKNNGSLKNIGENLHTKARKHYSIKNFSESVYNTYIKLLHNNK